MTSHECPSISGIIAAANRTLDHPTFHLLSGSDHHVVRRTFLDWQMVAEAHGHPPDFGGPRALLKHRDGPWWLLLYPQRGGFRLLPGREWQVPDAFRFSTDQQHGNVYVVGTADDVLAYAVKRHRTGQWSTDVLLWFLDHMPDAETEAERMMLAFWFAEQQAKTR